MTELITDMFPEAPPVDVDAVPDERYTTPTTMDWIKRIVGVDAFDLDVAACAESHWAPRYYTKETNGLIQPWIAPRIFCNPPYSDILPWVLLAWAACLACNFEVLPMVLPANRTDQPWWQEHIEPRRDKPGSPLRAHFIPSRVRYGHPGNPHGKGSGSPPFASVLLVWRAS